MKKGLFVYGTLHPDRAPDEIRDAVSRLTLLGAATIFGELRDLGEYPALVQRGARQCILGMLFALPDEIETLQKLDAYEGFDPLNPKASLFRRRLRTVTLPDGRKERHWVYVYNRDLPRRDLS